MTRHGFYPFLLSIPDRCYPFKNEVEGQWVRGMRSYDAALARAKRLYGPGHLGYALGAYRQFTHLVGAILVLLAAAYASDAFFGGTRFALAAFLVVAILLISFQEFYWHPRYYAQLWRKGVIDWLAWCVPFGAYLFLIWR